MPETPQNNPPTPWQTDVATRIALLEKDVKDLSHGLYGNGQPGVLGKLERRLDGMDARLSRMDEKLGRILVIIGALAGGSGIGVGAILKALFGA